LLLHGRAYCCTEIMLNLRDDARRIAANIANAVATRWSPLRHRQRAAVGC
jgi:hypothetical protein